jgi:DNA polymerase III subunit delta
MSGIDSIKQKFTKNTPPLVIALGGSERALIDEAVEFLRKKCLTPESRAFNHSRLVAGESDLSQLGADLSTMPFLANMRLIEVHAAEKLDEKTSTLLIKYLENPSSTSLLVVVFSKVDKRNKLISALITKGFYYSFDIANDHDLVSIVLGESKSQGIKISKDVAHFLVLVCDKDLLAIKAGLSKLALLFENREVLINDIEQHLCSHGEQDVFLLARAISEGKLAESLFTLGLVRNSQENALKFLGVLMWQFRVLLRIRHGLDEGLSDQEISKQASVYGDRLRWMMAVARKKTITFHINRLTRLLECDVALKTLNTKEPFNVIEKAVYQSAAGL